MDYTHEIKQYSNELHKRVVKNFPTRKINVNFKNEIFGIDLADMITYKDENDGYAYIFVIEDLFTRKAWTIPLKDKKSKTVAIALDKLFTAIQSHPLYLWSDKGGEFYNTDMTKLLKKYNIHHYSVYGQSKVAPVERLNQTLKHIMFKKLTEMQSHRWIDILEYVIDKYNNNTHSSIGISPNQAYQNPEHIKHKVDLDVKPYIQTSTDKPKYHLGDYVRVSRLKNTFEKGYDANFTSEIFQIVEIDNSYPITYKLNDLMREPIEGSFYEEELQKTEIPHDFALVEKVLKTRKIKGKTELLVKWLGQSEKFNSWINANDAQLFNK